MKQKCTCPCHQPGNTIIHIKPCCYNGYIAGIDPYEKGAEPESLGSLHDPITPICMASSPEKKRDGLFGQVSKQNLVKYGEVVKIGPWEIAECGIYIFGGCGMPYSEPARSREEIEAALIHLEFINKYNLHSLI